jgi:TatD DNase family protein
VFVDSHCHLDFPELANRVGAVLTSMAENRVTHALCVGVSLKTQPRIMALVAERANLFASVGVHPEHKDEANPSIEELLGWASDPKIVAIGETGLDYFWHKEDLAWQQQRFRDHIRAARKCAKPLIVHMREAAVDTLTIMEEERAGDVGGVMHCFTESLSVAEKALALGFHISFSGIVTFKNAKALKAVAQAVPLERMLIETDAPYLAPSPYRGRINEPTYVKFVAEEIARLRGISLEEVAEKTSQNFFRLFGITKTETMGGAS